MDVYSHPQRMQATRHDVLSTDPCRLGLLARRAGGSPEGYCYWATPSNVEKFEMYSLREY